eukprot:5835850-Amphidinium_carterae.1
MQSMPMSFTPPEVQPQPMQQQPQQSRFFFSQLRLCKIFDSLRPHTRVQQQVRPHFRVQQRVHLLVNTTLTLCGRDSCQE